MITPKVDCYFYIEIDKEPAELIAKTVSKNIMMDIEKAVLLSKDFSDDISAHHEFSDVMGKVEKLISAQHETTDDRNPLYYPHTIDEISEGLEENEAGTSYKINFMGGNPYIIRNRFYKNVNSDEIIAGGRLIYKDFDMPAYEEIVKNNKVTLN